MSTHSIEKTTDGGFTWDSTYNSKGGLDINFINIHTGYICGGLSTMQKSTDGGNSWYNQTVPSGIYLSIQFFDSLLGYAGGTKMIKTTDGGGPVSSIQLINNEIPVDFELFQNYPNPFNPTTNIKFNIKQSGFVKLNVFDITGKEVDVLVNAELSLGEYEYQFDGTGLSSGIYFYRIQTKAFTDIKKMILVK